MSRRSREHLYLIVPLAAATRALVRQCVETSPQTLRRNVAGTHVVLKFAGGRLPSRLLGTAQVYSQQEIQRLMHTAEWQPVGDP